MKSKQKKETVAVAVLTRNINALHSLRPEGDFACFLGQTEVKAVQKAMDAKMKWGPNYYILVGTLVGYVSTPKKYKVEKLVCV